MKKTYKTCIYCNINQEKNVRIVWMNIKKKKIECKICNIIKNRNNYYKHENTFNFNNYYR